MLSSEEKQYLENIWSDPKHAAAFSGPEKLYKFVKKDGQFKIGLSAINRFLSNLEAYSLQKRVQRKFKRSPVLVCHLLCDVEKREWISCIIAIYRSLLYESEKGLGWQII